MLGFKSYQRLRLKIVPNSSSLDACHSASTIGLGVSPCDVLESCPGDVQYLFMFEGYTFTSLLRDVLVYQATLQYVTETGDRLLT